MDKNMRIQTLDLHLLLRKIKWFGFLEKVNEFFAQPLILLSEEIDSKEPYIRNEIPKEYQDIFDNSDNKLLILGTDSNLIINKEEKDEFGVTGFIPSKISSIFYREENELYLVLPLNVIATSTRAILSIDDFVEENVEIFATLHCDIDPTTYIVREYNVPLQTQEEKQKAKTLLREAGVEIYDLSRVVRKLPVNVREVVSHYLIGLKSPCLNSRKCSNLPNWRITLHRYYHDSFDYEVKDFVHGAKQRVYERRPIYSENYEIVGLLVGPEGSKYLTLRDLHYLVVDIKDAVPNLLISKGEKAYLLASKVKSGGYNRVQIISEF